MFIIDIIILIAVNAVIDATLVLILNPSKVETKIKQAILNDKPFIEDMVGQIMEVIFKRKPIKQEDGTVKELNYIDISLMPLYNLIQSLTPELKESIGSYLTNYFNAQKAQFEHEAKSEMEKAPIQAFSDPRMNMLLTVVPAKYKPLIYAIAQQQAGKNEEKKPDSDYWV